MFEVGNRPLSQKRKGWIQHPRVRAFRTGFLGSLKSKAKGNKRPLTVVEHFISHFSASKAKNKFSTIALPSIRTKELLEGGGWDDVTYSTNFLRVLSTDRPPEHSAIRRGVFNHNQINWWFDRGGPVSQGIATRLLSAKLYDMANISTTLPSSFNPWSNFHLRLAWSCWKDSSIVRI